MGGVERFPPIGRKARLASERTLPGGQVATALLAATRLGLRCALAGAVGDDDAADAALAPLRRAGVDLSRVETIRGARTRQAWVLVESTSGERTVLEQRDPALRLPAAGAAPAWPSARAVLVDLEHPAASQQAAEAARSAGVPVLLDADRPSPEALELLRRVDFPIVSEGFADEFSSDVSLEARLAALARAADPAVRMVVVTCGAAGSVARIGERLVRTPAPRVAAVDTTGAGDVFRGAFAWGLLRGLDPEQVLRVANTAAALGCRGAGAQGALPDAAAVEASLAGGV